MTAAAAPGRALTLPTTSTGRPILARANLDTYDPRPQRSGGRERYFCPIHGGDHQRSLSVEPQTGYYTCHSCGAKGTLREHWDHWPPGGGARRAARAPSLEEIGRQVLAAKGRAEFARAARLAGDLPQQASAFLSRLDTFVDALRAPDSPGAAYLRGRGLDPSLAASLGAGYAALNTWPGDRGRKIGRVVYPLADPATGRVVSALGRLCVDEDPTWPEAVRVDFARVKQRKLAGCPAGVWPYASVAAAVEVRWPLVTVEGPADALALLQRTRGELAVVALLGTANVLPAALLRDLPGVVMALDEDGPGAKARRELRAEFAIAGVRVEALPVGWLGAAKDIGEIAREDPCDATVGAASTPEQTYARAVEAVHAACARLTTTGWDEDRAGRLIMDLYERCAEACATLPQPWPTIPEEADLAIDQACATRDWSALETAIAACERTYANLVRHRKAAIEP